MVLKYGETDYHNTATDLSDRLFESPPSVSNVEEVM